MRGISLDSILLAISGFIGSLILVTIWKIFKDVGIFSDQSRWLISIFMIVGFGIFFGLYHFFLFKAVKFKILYVVSICLLLVLNIFISKVVLI